MPARRQTRLQIDCGCVTGRCLKQLASRPAASQWAAPPRATSTLPIRDDHRMTTLSTRADEITQAAIASFVNCPDPRLRQILQSLVKHLHAFATEVRLTPEEWEQGIAILKQTGDITDDKRSEFILWSDAL